jgi:hypothetical protein
LYIWQQWKKEKSRPQHLRPLGQNLLVYYTHEWKCHNETTILYN